MAGAAAVFSGTHWVSPFPLTKIYTSDSLHLSDFGRTVHYNHSQVLQLFLGIVDCIVGLIELVLLVGRNCTLKLLESAHWTSTAWEEHLDITWSHISRLFLAFLDGLLKDCLLGACQ